MRAFLAILFFTWLLGHLFPWWSVLAPALLFGAWLFENGTRAFVIGFAAAGLAWFLPALVIHIANDGILSTRIADMMQAGSPWVVLFITFLIGGILGGLGTLCGYLFKAVFRAKGTEQKA